MNSTTSLLDALACKGVLISVSIRYWRACRKLKPEDLGLATDQVNDRLISLGHKRLLPKDCLRSLALLGNRAHALVDENTFPFLNGVARYLPNERLTDVNARLGQLQNEFTAERDAFLTDYPVYRERALTEWEATARRLVDDPERLVAVIESAFPLPGSMERHFGFHVSLFQVSVPDVPRADLIDAGTQQELIDARAAAAREARERIASSCDEFIRDCTVELRSQTARLCTEMLETINGTGSVHQKTLNRLVRFIDHFRELNFVNDAEMELQLEKVRSGILQRTAGEYRDSASARDRLVSGLTALRNRASAMAREDVSALVENFGALGRRKFTLAA